MNNRVHNAGHGRRYHPAEQGTHVRPLPNVPGGQRPEHVGGPGSAVSARPRASLKVPRGQAEHGSWPVELNVPSGHSWFLSNATSPLCMSHGAHRARDNALAYGRRTLHANGRGSNAASSKQQAASSKQQAVSSKQRAASSKQQAASSKQQAASSKQQTASSKQRATHVDIDEQAQTTSPEVAHGSAQTWLSRETSARTTAQDSQKRKLVPTKRALRACGLTITSMSLSLSKSAAAKLHETARNSDDKGKTGQGAASRLGYTDKPPTRTCDTFDCFQQ
jgi:hypothetical protein